MVGGALLTVTQYATIAVAVLKEKTVRCAAHQRHSFVHWQDMRLQYKTRVLRKILPVKECLLYSMGSLVPDTVTDEHVLSVKGAVSHPMM